MSQILGQQFIVENRTGAGSNLAAAAVARAPKDGYTLFIGSSANAINAAMDSYVAFDFAKDFAPVTLLALDAKCSRRKVVSRRQISS